MRFFLILSILLIACIAIFAVQNSTAPAILIKFLPWKMETSLIYVIFGSFASGMFFMLFLWVPPAIKSLRRTRNLKKQIEVLRKERDHRIEGTPPSKADSERNQ